MQDLDTIASDQHRIEGDEIVKRKRSRGDTGV